MRISDWSSDVCSSDLFEAPAQVGDGAIAPNMAADPVQEQAIELGGERAQAAKARKVRLVGRQWRHAAQPAVRGTVIDLFQPGPQPGIEVVQAVDLGGVQFAEELVAAGAMPAFELAFALGGIGPAIDE